MQLASCLHMAPIPLQMLVDMPLNMQMPDCTSTVTCDMISAGKPSAKATSWSVVHLGSVGRREVSAGIEPSGTLPVCMTHIQNLHCQICKSMDDGYSSNRQPEYPLSKHSLGLPAYLTRRCGDLRYLVNQAAASSPWSKAVPSNSQQITFFNSPGWPKGICSLKSALFCNK